MLSPPPSNSIDIPVDFQETCWFFVYISQAEVMSNKPKSGLEKGWENLAEIMEKPLHLAKVSI